MVEEESSESSMGEDRGYATVQTREEHEGGRRDRRRWNLKNKDRVEAPLSGAV